MALPTTSTLPPSPPRSAAGPSPIAAAVERVAAHREAWRTTTAEQKCAYLSKAIAGVLEVAGDWVRAACRAKGIDPASPLAGEEWLAGPMTTVRHLRLYRETLSGRGLPVSRWHERPGGELVARVFPNNAQEKLLFGGVGAEVWIEPGMPASSGRRGPGGCAAVLGAGNVSSIGPLDVLDQLVVRDRVAVLKMNPVNEYVGPFVEAAFAELVRAGFLAVVYGGAAAGAELVHHPSIDAVHLTGSDRTYDAIVWGADPAERERRKAANDPLLRKPVSAELGCVTPVLVTPGPWSPAELRFQAQHVAAMVAHNASHNCNAAKVLVTAKGWPQRQAFLDELRRAFRETAARASYYPGSQQKWQGFLSRYPQAEQLGPPLGDAVRWTLIADVPPQPGEYAFQNEAWCGVLAETALDCAAAAPFLEQAVPFVNEQVWGSLSCCLLAPPATPAAALERAVAGLRYGAVGVNAWPALIFGLGVTSWGAYPGHTPQDIRSGCGVVHNTFLIDHPQKSVLRAPFRIKPKPVWFAGHRTLDRIGRRLTAYEAAPSWGKVPAIAWAALRG